MITIQAFYKSYQLHHHRAKAGILMNLLGNKECLKAADIIEPLWGFNHEDYERTLRIELRANLFHAIDTLFTLYFCLQPDDTGKVDDIGLFRNLNKRKFYYKQIKNIAARGIESLNILDTLVNFGNTNYVWAIPFLLFF